MTWYQWVWMWWGTRICGWTYVDLKKNKDSDDLEAMTFSKSEEYINKISEIE